jgi:hypothetical protein
LAHEASSRRSAHTIARQIPECSDFLGADQEQVLLLRQVPEQHSLSEAQGKLVRRQHLPPLQDMEPPLVAQHSPS